MDKQSAPQSNKTRITIAVLVVLVIVLAVLLIIQTIRLQNISEDPTEGSPIRPVESSSEPTHFSDESEPSTIETFTFPSTEATEATECNDIQIRTPYCTLHFPPELTGSIRFRSEEGEGTYRVIGTALVGNKEADVFAVVFGESSEMPVGTIRGDDGSTTTVRINLDMFEPGESWTEEEIAQANTVLDGINYLLEALAQEEAFE